MTVTCNHLNLPTAISFGSNGSISILYNQTSKKLRKTAAPTAGGGYTQDGLEYRTNSGGTLTLEAIYHAEGRIKPVGASYQYEYYIKDHLGSLQLSFTDFNANGIVDVPGDILQENQYYPFWTKMNYTWMDNVALDNKYQFNGLEVVGKTPFEIDARAKQIGLQPKRPDLKSGKGSYDDPKTGTQRILGHPNDKNGPHGHVNNAAGKRLDENGNVVSKDSEGAHLPIKKIITNGNI